MDQYERENRIKEALSIRKMKQVELAERTGFSKGVISSWVSQRWQPKYDAIVKMAQVLDVSEMWLAGYDTPMDRPAAQKKMDGVAQLVNIIRKDEKFCNLVATLAAINSDQLRNENFRNLILNIASLNEAQLKIVENTVNEFTKVNHSH